MKRFIIDASVGAKWFFIEDLRDEATQYLLDGKRGDAELVVPQFFYAELMSVCLKRLKRGLTTFDEVFGISKDIMDLPLKSYPDKELAEVAFDNAAHYKISIYDSLYISLAEMYLAPLITADEQLFKACRKRFDFIEYLGNFR